MKTKIVSGLLALAIAVSPIAVAAASEGSLINSGDHVKISQDSTNVTKVDVSNKNVANINQSASANVNTGGNSADRNIGHGGVSGSVVSGNAYFGANFDASANSNNTFVSAPSGQNSGAQRTDVVNTGDHVRASSNTNNVTRVTVDNFNKANIDQNAYFKANTGYNSADRNVGGGSVTSGNVGFDAGFSAGANHNATAVSVGNGWSPWGEGSSLGVVNTGDHVNASSDTSNKTSVSVKNWNALWLNQSAREHVITGKNAADRDIGGGSVYSGDAYGSAYFSAGPANTNMTYVDASPWGSLLGAWSGWWY